MDSNFPLLPCQAPFIWPIPALSCEKGSLIVPSPTQLKPDRFLGCPSNGSSGHVGPNINLEANRHILCRHEHIDTNANFSDHLRHEHIDTNANINNNFVNNDIAIEPYTNFN